MTRMAPSWKRWLLSLVVGLLLSGGAALWWQWTPVVVWYHVRGLCRATEGERAGWAAHLAAHSDAALPALVTCLKREEEQLCDNVRFALTHILESWAPDDPRQAEFAGQLAHRFPEFSVTGQRAALLTVPTLLRPSGAVPPALTHLLTQAAQQPDSAVRLRALDLANELVERDSGTETLTTCRTLAGQGLRDEAAEVRLQAIRLAQAPGLACLDRVVPLLDDPAVEVRRAAMIAVGTARDAIAEDDLLRWLHDTDGEVRTLCEQALRGRGLQDQHLKLGRLLTDREPGARLQVLEQLRRANDLEPGVWLRRLSHDAVPAVRAAAVRAAAEQPFVNLRDRLEQMAQNDPSPTVRELAQFYLRTPKSLPRE